jgi:DegV family protein with EDD domain
MSVRTVTDSACSLPSGAGVLVVPLRVGIDGQVVDESDLTADQLVVALRTGRTVTTSQPAAESFESAYARLADEGASAIVSIHLSGHLSSTCGTARVAASRSRVPVIVVDSGSAGLGLGFAVRAGVDAAGSGAAAVDVVAAVEDSLWRTEVLFYVDTLEFLRRGGRIGSAAALLGSALSVKPILRLDAGKIVAAEKVRTAARGLARLAELAVAAGGGDADYGVQQVGATERAAELSARLGELDPGAGPVMHGEIGAAIGAHVGPGTLAVTVRRRRAS